MAGGSVYFSIEITSRIDKTYINGDSINAIITKKSGEFPEGAHVTSGRLTFSNLRVFTRHEAGLNFSEWFSASEAKLNEGGGFYAFENVSVSDNIIDLSSDSVTVDIFGPDKLESGLYAFKTKSATLEVKYEIPPEGPGGGEPGGGEPGTGEDENPDNSYDNEEEGSKYNITLSPNTNKVIPISEFCKGKRFTISHNYPQLKNNTHWGVTASLFDYEDTILYYKDSFNNVWAPVEDSEIIYENKLPSYISFKTNKIFQLESSFYIDFWIGDIENNISYGAEGFNYWIGTEQNKDTYWEFGFNLPRKVKKDALVSGISGEFLGEFLPENYLDYDVNLAFKASLESGTPLYIENSILAPAINNDPSLPNSSRFQKMPSEGLALPLEQSIHSLFNFYTDQELNNNDLLRISIFGTINGIERVWGANNIIISSCTACKAPTSTSITVEKQIGSNLQQVISERCLVEWHNAQGGIDNEIIGYEFYRKKTISSGEVETVLIKEISTNLGDGRCYLPTPEPGELWSYSIKVIGSAKDNSLNASKNLSSIKRITEIGIIEEPREAVLNSNWQNANSFITIKEMTNANNNNINKIQLQRKELIEGEESSWLLIDEIPITKFSIEQEINYTGEYEYYQNERNEYVFKAKTNGILTVNNDMIVDIFAVGGGGSGSKNYCGGSGYTTTKFNLHLLKGKKYLITIGQGGLGEGVEIGYNGEDTFMVEEFIEDKPIIQAFGGFGANATGGGNGGSGGAVMKDNNTKGEPAYDGASAGSINISNSNIPNIANGGIGQGFTTRAFMDPIQQLYSSGGGASKTDPNAGSFEYGSSSITSNAASNYGCGGGIYFSSSTARYGGAGGSGAILLRKSNTFVFPTPSPLEIGKEYKYRIRLIGDAGNKYGSNWVNVEKGLIKDVDRISPFTDEIIIPGETLVKAIHISEMQDYLNLMLQLYKQMPAVNFTEVIANETNLKDWTNHINEIRNSFDLFNSPHEDWLEIPINQPKANVTNQLRDILKQGYLVKVNFFNGDELVHSQYVRYGDEVIYNGPEIIRQGYEFSYVFSGWSLERNGKANEKACKCITEETNLYACFIPIPALYQVVYKNQEETLYRDLVRFNLDSNYLGETPINKEVNDPENYKLNYWFPEPKNVDENLVCRPIFIHKNLTETIHDSWEEIIENIHNGTHSNKYKIGDTKSLYLGNELGWINMTLKAKSYENVKDNSKIATTSWISEQFLPISVNTSYTEAVSVNPWETSVVRNYLYNNIYPNIPQLIRDNITPIIKEIQGENYEEELWLPSVEELSSNGIYKTTTKKTNLNGNYGYWIVNNGFINSGSTNGTVNTDNFPTGNGKYYYPILCFCIGTTNKYLE